MLIAEPLTPEELYLLDVHIDACRDLPKRWAEVGLEDLYRRAYSYIAAEVAERRRPTPDGGERLEGPLRSLITEVGHFPSHRDFVARGDKRLYFNLTRVRSMDEWAHRLGYPDRDERRMIAVEAELRARTEEIGGFPAFRTFELLGETLYWRILALDDVEGWAGRLGYPDRRTRREEELEAELRAFVAGRSRFPSYPEFEAAGQKALYTRLAGAGGVAAWAERIGLPHSFDRIHHDDAVLETLRELSERLGHFPYHRDFSEAGESGLYLRIIRHEGLEHWAARLGLEYDPPERLTAEAVEAELREIFERLGHFPSASELRGAGRVRLYTYCSVRGGLAAWAARLDLPYRGIVGKRRTEAEAVEQLRRLAEHVGAPLRHRDFVEAGEVGLYQFVRRRGGIARWMTLAGLDD